VPARLAAAESVKLEPWKRPGVRAWCEGDPAQDFAEACRPQRDEALPRRWGLRRQRVGDRDALVRKADLLGPLDG